MGSREAGAGALALDGTKGTWGAVGATPIDTSASFAVDAWVEAQLPQRNQTFVSSYGANVSPFYLQLAGGKFTFTTVPPTQQERRRAAWRRR